MKADCRHFVVLAFAAGVLNCPNTSAGIDLSIAASGNAVVLSWPASGSNYVPQTTLNLSAPNWVTVTNPAPLVSNSIAIVTYTNSSLERFFRLYLNTNTASPTVGMVLIPGGTFSMGDVNDENINGDAAPMSISVSAFYMDSNLVTYAKWLSVYSFAVNTGYGFGHGGDGKAADHPAQSMDWFDAVKWCNARSQQAGLTAVYFTDAGLTQIYTNHPAFPETNTVYVNWSASGFRLPTEAEWERAARGGQSGRRFPWGNFISQTNANYYGQYNGDFYDLAPPSYNPAFYGPPLPYTSPVGHFAPNAYGLYDMAGNVMEWCWDWYGTPYGQPTASNPTGPYSGTDRVLRGGDWTSDASLARCADRNNYFYGYYSPNVGLAINQIGFRCVKTP
jgi:formylglycine-generating enzyme